MKISEILDLRYELLTENDTANREFASFYATDLLSSAIKSANSHDILITIISHQNTVGLAMMIDLSGIIIAEDKDVSKIMIDKANEEGIAIIRTSMKTHEIIKDLVIRGFL
jgi:hypothetical protein